MPTLLLSDVSKYLVKKGTKMYLSNECSETPYKNTVYPPINDGENTGALLVFESKRDLYFAEGELVGATLGGVSIFVLAHEDRDIAKFIVVGTYDIVVIEAGHTSTLKLNSKRFHYEDVLPS
jgi:hypothetical protein